MRKWKVAYLWFIVIIFILLWIPYFQNVWAEAWAIAFFNQEFSFVGIYPVLLFLWVLEWSLIVLYMISLISDLKKQEPKKFDL